MGWARFGVGVRNSEEFRRRQLIAGLRVIVFHRTFAGLGLRGWSPVIQFFRAVGQLSRGEGGGGGGGGMWGLRFMA